VNQSRNTISFQDDLHGLSSKRDTELKSKRDLLVSIPGISDTTIAVILSELNGMEHFDNPQKVVAFIGLAPKDTLSGISAKGKPRICKIGNSRLRKSLYMPALAAIRHNPIISVFL
jgi:transposase